MSNTERHFRRLEKAGFRSKFRDENTNTQRTLPGNIYPYVKQSKILSLGRSIIGWMGHWCYPFRASQDNHQIIGIMSRRYYQWEAIDSDTACVSQGPSNQFLSRTNAASAFFCTCYSQSGNNRQDNPLYPKSSPVIQAVTVTSSSICYIHGETISKKSKTNVWTEFQCRN